MLLRHIRKAGLDPARSRYELLAVGPIFPEQRTLSTHRKYRNIVAPLEAALARHVEGLGYTVVGTHSSKHPLDARLFGKVLRHAKPLLEALPANISLERR